MIKYNRKIVKQNRMDDTDVDHEKKINAVALKLITHSRSLKRRKIETEILLCFFSLYVSLQNF